MTAQAHSEALQQGRAGRRRWSGLPRSDARAERVVIRAAEAGEQAAIEALYRRHWPLAYRAAYLIAHDAAAAEDIAQESFLAAVRALDRFDRRRPFGPWLARIAANRAIDWTRARTLRREVAGDDAVDAAGPDLAREPYSKDLLEALAALSPDHRTVIVLRYLLDYTPGEIADLLGLPRGTVNSRLRRGLDGLAGAVVREART
jgi:RNA polymerase sigma-70 factor (ECF subfamily)